MVIIGWIALSALAATFFGETAFMVLYSAQRALKADALPNEARMVAYFWLVVGYVADIVFNLTRGTIMFRELPHELLFSSRVQRHVDKSSGWRRERAVRWGRFLNAVDPGHIHGLDEGVAQA